MYMCTCTYRVNILCTCVLVLIELISVSEHCKFVLFVYCYYF